MRAFTHRPMERRLIVLGVKSSAAATEQGGGGGGGGGAPSKKACARSSSTRSWATEARRSDLWLTTMATVASRVSPGMTSNGPTADSILWSEGGESSHPVPATGSPLTTKWVGVPVTGLLIALPRRSRPRRWLKLSG